jgi:hypothetical protein
MPSTPNYGWSLPDVGGSLGAWGGGVNGAFTSADATVKALADRVAAAEAELAGALSVVSVTASASVTASGNIIAGSALGGASVSALNAGMTNDAVTASAIFGGGAIAGGGLGNLYAQIAVNPSATAANRYMRLQVGDDVALRKFGVLASQMYIGDSTPAFVAGERLRVVGGINATTVSSIFYGDGSNLTGLPQSAVVGLVSDLAALAAINATQTTNIATAQSTADTARSENITWARVVPPGSLGYDTPTTSGSRTAFLPAAVDSSSLAALGASLTPVIEKLKALVTDLKTRGLI